MSTSEMDIEQASSDTGLQNRRKVKCGLALLSSVALVLSLAAAIPGPDLDTAWGVLDNDLIEVRAGLLSARVHTKALYSGSGVLQTVNRKRTEDYSSPQCVPNLGGESSEACPMCTIVGSLAAGFLGFAVFLQFSVVVFLLTHNFMNSKVGMTFPFAASLTTALCQILTLVLYSICHGTLLEYQTGSSSFDFGPGFALAITSLLLTAITTVLAFIERRTYGALDDPDKLHDFFCCSKLGCVTTFIIVVSTLVGIVVPLVELVTINACSVAPVAVNGGASTNIVLHLNHAFVSLGSGGVLVSLLAAPFTNQTYAPSFFGTGSVTQLHVDTTNNLLFVINPGTNSFSVASINAVTPTTLTLASGPFSEPMSPTSQIRAEQGNLVVSGGIQHVSFYSYTTNGATVTRLSQNAFNRGGPGVDILPNGEHIFLATHVRDDIYGVTAMTLPKAGPLRRPLVNQMEVLDGSGCSAGYAQPSNWAIATAWTADLQNVYVASGAGVTAYALDSSFASYTTPLTGKTTLTIPNFSPVDIAVQGSTAYVVGAALTAGGANFYRLDLTNRLSPAVSSSAVVPGDALAIAVDASHVVIANNQVSTFWRGTP